MTRFVAIIWNGSDPGSTKTAESVASCLPARLPELRSVFATSGLAVFSGPAAPHSAETHLLAHPAGVVLGKLFNRASQGKTAQAPSMLSELESAKLLATGGRSLLTAYWGRYVALLHNSDNQATFVVPDPTGDMRCYFINYRDITILFSAVDDCTTLTGIAFSVNWRYIVTALAYPDFQGRETGLREVSWIRPGECLRFQRGAPVGSELYWDLLEIAQSAPLENMESAVATARTTVQECVDAWASCYPQIVHCLSGGLDSSIVLACLMHAPTRPSVACINHFDQSAGGDERRFARLAAEWIPKAAARPCDFVEYERDPAAVRVESLLNIKGAALPSAYTALWSHRHIDLQMSRGRHAAIFTGAGGDYVFYRRSGSLPAVDYMRQHGLRGEFFRLVYERSLVNGDTFWHGLLQTLGDGLLRRKQSHTPVLTTSPLITQDVLVRARAESPEYLTPVWQQPGWLAKHPSVPPHKLQHIDTMHVQSLDMNPFVELGDIEWVEPLQSQPIFELFARIPVYVLQSGSIDRIVARRAFADVLPEALLTRCTKGFMDSYMQSIFRLHEPFFRELLLDGVLVKQGLLDRRKVEDVFSSSRDGYTSSLTALLGQHADLEIWLRRWCRPGYSAVSAAA